MDNRSDSAGHADTPPRQPSSGAVIRLLQITDTHLYADPAGTLLGVNTLESCSLVVEMAQQQENAADAIVTTGDLVHDGSRQGYRHLREQLLKLNLPTYCLPGNHDHPETLEETMSGGLIHANRAVELGAWSLLFLDSTLPGSETGHLNDFELDHLAGYLADHRERPTLLCMHHQPVHIGSAWMDTMALDNPDPFFAIIDANPQVKGILWGHIHQSFEEQRHDVRLIGSPSTCVQFLPKSDAFALDDVPPAYRWLELHEDGAIHTGIRRVASYASGIEMESLGY